MILTKMPHQYLIEYSARTRCRLLRQTFATDTCGRIGEYRQICATARKIITVVTVTKRKGVEVFVSSAYICVVAVRQDSHEIRRVYYEVQQTSFLTRLR